MERTVILLFLLTAQHGLAQVGIYHYDACSQAWHRREQGFSKPTLWELTGKFDVAKATPWTDPSQDVAEASLKVYSTYRALLERKKKSKTFIDQFINELIQQDKSADKRLVRYFVYRDPVDLSIRGVARALINVSDRTVEFGRLVALPRPNQTPVSKELAYTASEYLSEVFGSQPFSIFSYCDAGHARLYEQDYHFKILETPQQTSILDRYKVGIDGQTYIFIYAGHIRQAYGLGVRRRSPDEALAFLADVETRYKLQNYMPTQHVKQHLSIMKAVFNGTDLPRWSVAQQFALAEKSDANIDFEVIYYARAIYDLLRYRGSPKFAVGAIDRHLLYLQNLDVRSTKRTKYFLELSALIQAHDGNTVELAKIRASYGEDLREEDLKAYAKFKADFNRHFPDGIVPNIETNVELIAIKREHLDPAFHNFVQCTNPLIHQDLADIYQLNGFPHIADMLSRVALGAYGPM